MANPLLTQVCKVAERLSLTTEEIPVFLALCYLTDDYKKAVEIYEKQLCYNMQTSSTWEEIKEKALIFAEQVRDSFPEKWDEAEQFIQKLQALEGEELIHYLRYRCGYFLFPELKVAFSLSDEVVGKYGITR
jgi:hypothetical protein